ncbi:hypothetical protein SAMN04489727_1921 [Amycolatopsis tolypomycina]|uniref:Uncharacterized protein n=1 Tax=Amycolatopsis tolypomycina TaxID=208445 RepID=A0A1H4JI22_9PSEU|nr:hypothetical protein [Amycolatopsis tolypomycina]SEB45923.1 hypothetical protein SAMN04489727_1921 [Amycolatopsis tolypomycina]
MKTRTLWAALLAGEPGVIFGVSVLAFVVIVTVVLVFCDLAPRRAEVSDGRPTVWQLQQQNPRNREEWLRQRVEAYRDAVRPRAAEAVRQEAAELTDRDAQLVALVTEDDWPTLEDLNAAEHASADVGAGASSVAAQACEPRPIAPQVSSRSRLRGLAQREPRPLLYGRPEIAA